MRFDEGLKLYLDDMRINNLSPMSVHTKNHALRQFYRWLKLKGTWDELEQFTPDLFEDYKKYLFEKVNARGKPYEPKSRHSLLQACRTMFAFLHANRHLPSNPTQSLKCPKIIKRMPLVLKVSDVKKILQAPDLSTHVGTRDRAVLELLWSSALRESEICNLNLADLDFNSKLIKVNLGKGRRDRHGIFGGIAKRYLKRYIEMSRPLLAQQGSMGTVPSNALFLTYRGERMTADTLYNLVKKYAELAKIQKNVYPHIFRATAATEMLRKGANPYIIQVYLGHSSMSSIDAYLSITAQDLTKGFRRFHPRALDEKQGKNLENIDESRVLDTHSTEKAVAEDGKGV